jgi:arsenical pump membrane protein
MFPGRVVAADRDRWLHCPPMVLRARAALVATGAAAALVAVVADHRDALTAASRTWPPFVLVAGLLTLGAVAHEDGVFAAAGDLLDRVPGGEGMLYVAAMGLVALVTVFLNLDTSVAFLTPALIYAGRHRGSGQLRLLYGCVFMSNAASLLLPGSNLTNLLVLSGRHVSGSALLARTLPPWVAAVVVTGAVGWLAFRSPRPGPAGGSRGVPSPAASGPVTRPRPLSLVGIVAAVVLILVVPSSALPVLAVGLGLAALRFAQRRITLDHIQSSVDVQVLGGLFLVATTLGTIARVWSYPGRVMHGAGMVASAAIGAVASVLVNNLPAAVLLGSRMPAHPVSLLYGLDIGPNLAVTGSLSALVWWEAAHSLGATPSARRYSAVGVVLVPVTLAAALLAERFVHL